VLKHVAPVFPAGLAVVIGSVVNVRRISQAQTPPGLLNFRLDAPLFAINARAMRDLVRDAVRQAPAPVDVVLFDKEMTPELDICSVDQLLDLHRELQADGIER
jgi:MFS superfamily sulfate permease-like transporter